MAKLKNYDGGVELIAGITQKNGGDFALAEAHAIQTDESGTRLDKDLADLKDKSYEVGNGLTVDEQTKTLSVDVATEAEQNNTKPISSAAVHAIVGNINVLLETI